MINAYMLIIMRPGNTDKAITEMRKIENVDDIVVRVHVKHLENLLKVTEKIQMIKGVKKTTTQVIEKELAL